MEGEQVVEQPVIDLTPLERAMGRKPAAQPVVDDVAAKAAQETKDKEAAIAAEKEKAAAAQQPALNIDDLTDDQINALIEKKTGGKVKTLAELNEPPAKTKEELEKEKETRKADALTWAFDNKKIKKEDYDNAIIGKSKSDRDIALSVFTTEAQAENKDLTTEEAEELFKDAYHEIDPESNLYKIGQKEIKKLADATRKEKFNIPDYEAEFDEFTELNNNFKAYKATVKKVAADISKEFEIKQPYQYLDGAKEDIIYKIPMDEKLFNKILADATTEVEFLNRNSNGKIDEKQLAKEIQHHMKAVMFDQAIQNLLDQNTKEVEKRIEVVLGNKRNSAPALNNGRQNLQTAAPKANDYSALDDAMSKMRKR